MRSPGKFLQVVGALALVAWTGAGSGAVEQNFGALVEEVRGGRDGQDELGGRLASLEAGVGELAARVAELSSAREAVPSVAAAVEPPAEVPAATDTVQDAAEAEPAPEPVVEAPPPAVEEAPPEPATRRSFLSFRLPSDDFRLDERRRWAVVPSLSRVGFDAKSTLHDFTGVTSDVEGELEVDLSRPTEGLGGEIRARVATLTTGLEDRDEEMLETLSAEAHPTIRYELTGFRSDADEGSGTALGDMTIRGVTRPLEVPLRWGLDDANRLLVEGEAPLRLPDWRVPVPKPLECRVHDGRGSQDHRSRAG